MATYPVERDKTFMFPDAMFKTRARPTHGGVDFTPVKLGENVPVYAVEAGVIEISSFSAGKAGHNIMIRTASGRRWWYGHLHRRDVSVNNRVREGQRIGLMGTTGNSSGVHLHLELHWPRMNVEVDPWPFLVNAPDINSKTIKPAPSREKALIDYPKEGEDKMNYEDRVWLQGALNDTEKRIRDDLRVNVAEQVAKALSAAEGARDALVKPVDGFAPIDVIRTHVVAILKAVREQAAKQGVALDEKKLTDGVLDTLAQTIVERKKN